ncbi:MAG: hypothetical protein CL770_06325 [Chloroflexi bacterium]|nr:hypothetical protein [Chloroflexota bacterium]|tara:strand:- start:8987 stop:10075 length:1089 start_codon:yes stop_codon:yes gene_type:complete
MKKYSVGIIGLGRMGSTIDDEGHPSVILPYSIAAACKASNNLELIAGADLSNEKREQFKNKWDINSVYENYETMIKEEKPDIVAICTKADVHSEIGIKVSNLNVPMIYLEKAIACSLKESDLLKSTCLKNKTIFNTGVMRRFDSVYNTVHKLINSGAIGTLESIIQYAHTTLLHGHIHSIDTISFLNNDTKIKGIRGHLSTSPAPWEPLTISNDISFTNNKLESDPSSTFELVFENDVKAWSIPTGKWGFEIIGTEGSIRTYENEREIILRQADKTLQKKVKGKIYSPYKSKNIPEENPKSATQVALEDLANAFENNQTTKSNIKHSCEIFETCMAISESHKNNNSWITLPLKIRDTYIFHI